MVAGAVICPPGLNAIAGPPHSPLCGEAMHRKRCVFCGCCSLSNEHPRRLGLAAIIALHLSAGNSAMPKGHSSEERWSLRQDHLLPEVKRVCVDVDAAGESCQRRAPRVSPLACSLIGPPTNGSVADSGATDHEGRLCTASVAVVTCTGIGSQARGIFHSWAKAYETCGPGR